MLMVLFLLYIICTTYKHKLRKCRGVGWWERNFLYDSYELSLLVLVWNRLCLLFFSRRAFGSALPGFTIFSGISRSLLFHSPLLNSPRFLPHFICLRPNQLCCKHNRRAAPHAADMGNINGKYKWVFGEPINRTQKSGAANF